MTEVIPLRHLLNKCDHHLLFIVLNARVHLWHLQHMMVTVTDVGENIIVEWN